ncbi:stranded at second transmembrane protein isoform X2 [Anticarsia gemmatalis]|uniref:stranded at second transmembrane protein isoform X2 n=1 Tax=Anticarsia gemmatalis TaxID=129554 RepID=UPI003F767A79
MGALGARGLAVWCALLVGSSLAAAYTVDCNHEYTDCDTELSKITGDDDDTPAVKRQTTTDRYALMSPPPPRLPEIETTTENRTEVEVATTPELPEVPVDLNKVPDAPEPMTNENKPKGRLLNLNVDELQNFANALHNDTNAKSNRKHLADLSDVNLDGDDEEETRMMPDTKNKEMPEKFYTNLQAPFHSLMNDRGSDEIDTCKENEVIYKVGDRMDRGCEETCECTSGGTFDCTPRCKHPYIRRGRRLNDPLCFESPVDECCSIIACATGSGDTKVSKLEVCRYGNETHPIGSKWHIGCEQTCFCDTNSVVTCKPRCNPLPVSDKCINVQDPNDACCEVQVCDVSHDAHEEPENTTTSTSTTTEVIKGFEDYDSVDSTPSRPLVLSEPIGSVKVLQNNSVQVNLMHMNKSEDPIHLLLSNNGGKSFSDVELKYSNLILNLEGGRDYILKTKETGTKFNFTITASDAGANEVPDEDLRNDTKDGCFHDGHFYAIGDEFHIGCEQLCECTGPDTRECAALVCPSHVGLELVSKGCVRWAPSPPATPPNCCPRSARCLSDGTCHYKGVAVPNWSEVPISLTGCEQRCFCENGELDCQEVCSSLPPVPPQSLRCPPNHRPAAVNISDEDCCKQWGCVPNAGNESAFQPYNRPSIGEIMNFVTPVPSTIPLPVILTPPHATEPVDFYRHLSPVKTLPKYIKTAFTPVTSSMPTKYDSAEESPSQPSAASALAAPTPSMPPQTPAQPPGNNHTIFALDDGDTTFKNIHPKVPFVNVINHNWEMSNSKSESKLVDPLAITYTNYNHHTRPQTPFVNQIATENKQQEFFQAHRSQTAEAEKKATSPEVSTTKYVYEPVRKIPLSRVENLNYFLPLGNISPATESYYTKHQTDHIPVKPSPIPEFRSGGANLIFFEPVLPNRTTAYYPPRTIPSPQAKTVQTTRDKPVLSKQVTILKTKDLKSPKPTDMYDDMFDQDSKTHLLTKMPNPYETVLLRAVPSAKIHMPSTRYNQNPKPPTMAGKTYTALDLEHLLHQMEVESVVNKNLGRSADKGLDIAEGQQATDIPSRPGFLPTIPPEIHFPQEDNDYDQGIRRPSSPIDPALAGLPPGLTLPPPYGDTNKKLSVITLEADSPTSVKMLFGLPTVLVGLRGSVDLRYTDKADEDISQWYSQVFAPADEILTTPRLEFRLAGLKPSTTYKIRGKLYLHNLPVEPESEIYTVRTLDLASVVPIEEKRREIDSRLTIVEVNDTTAQVTWRRFDEEELMHIDGIQVRYRPVGTPIYSMTELLHHSRSAAELHDLRPGTKYEASMVLVPPPKATTELTDPNKVEFTTAPYIDPYNWTVTIETRAIGSGAAEVWWRGVPAPAERWVRVFRAAHACNPTGGTDRHDLHDIHGHHGHDGHDFLGHDHDRHERDAFRLAARDLPPAITITGLSPDTKCRIWLELFLTNGKVKTSNVLEINTKSLDHPEPIDNEIESSSSVSGRSGDYYGALVGVGAVAALGALSSLLLLLVVLRRHRPRSVPITMPSAPRESSLPPYDNPAYKLELQQETMDL